MVFKKGAGSKRSFYKKKEEVSKEEEEKEDVGQEEEEEEDVGEESDNENKTPTKKLKTTSKTTTTASAAKKSSSGNEKSIELGGKRKISYSEFGGAPKIDIREFYEDKATKELKPGSKGISLTFEQFQVIADNIDTILSWTKKK